MSIWRKAIARIIACIVLLACAKEVVRVPYQSTELVPYIKLYEEIGREYGLNINVNGSVILETNWDGGTFVGYCFSNGVVKIKEEYWRVITEEEKIWLMFHELSHCYLNQDHRNDYIEYNGVICPKSIMNKDLISLYCIDYFSLNKTLFFNELFLFNK